MQREIKFRAWHFLTQQMLQNVPMGTIRVFTENGSYLATECFFMQYTGLTDKSGKEIFEGDIVSCEFEIMNDKQGWVKEIKTGEIRWNEKLACFQVFSKSNEFYDEDSSCFVWRDLEIIGNVFENKNLMD